MGPVADILYKFLDDLSRPCYFSSIPPESAESLTCKGRPSQTSDLVKACVLTTRWVFERPHTLDSVPNGQPLHLISMAPTA